MADNKEQAKPKTLQEVQQAAQAQAQQLPQVNRNPINQLQTTISQMVTTLREQHMGTEQKLGSSLEQAFTKITDSNKLNQISNMANQLHQMLGAGQANIMSNLPQIRQLVSQISTELYGQQAQVDRQIQKSIGQAASALAEAHTSMIDSANLGELVQMAKRCEDAISWVETPSRMVQ